MASGSGEGIRWGQVAIAAVVGLVLGAGVTYGAMVLLEEDPKEKGALPAGQK